MSLDAAITVAFWRARSSAADNFIERPPPARAGCRPLSRRCAVPWPILPDQCGEPTRVMRPRDGIFTSCQGADAAQRGSVRSRSVHRPGNDRRSAEEAPAPGNAAIILPGATELALPGARLLCSVRLGSCEVVQAKLLIVARTLAALSLSLA